METSERLGDCLPVAKLPARPRPSTEANRPRANFVRAWRKYRGNMTLEELAEKAGVSPSTISNIETRKYGYTWDSLEKIADALECEPGQLLSDPPPGILSSDFRSMDQSAREHFLELMKLFGKPPAGR